MPPGCRDFASNLSKLTINWRFRQEAEMKKPKTPEIMIAWVFDTNCLFGFAMARPTRIGIEVRAVHDCFEQA